MPTTLYVWDVENDSLIEELDGSGNSIVTYTQTPNQFGGTISEDRGGSTSYYHYDGLGSTLALSNQSGVVTDEYSYSAYGEVVASSGSTTNPFKYVGKYGYYTDSETNDIYIRARTYQPTVARWCSRDPVGYFAGSACLAEYCHGAPVKYIDPRGMQILPPTGPNPWQPPEAWPNPYPYPTSPLPPFPPRKPAPTPGTGTNVDRPLGMGYLWCGCKKKKDQSSTIPGIASPATNPISGVGPSRGTNATYTFPMIPPVAVGTGGAAPCVALVVKCPGFVSVYHFEVGDSPNATLGQNTFPAGCDAMVCGGSGEDQSDCLLQDVIDAAKRFNLVGVSEKTGCGVDAVGNWWEFGN